jgi:hypothetical protein
MFQAIRERFGLCKFFDIITNHALGPYECHKLKKFSTFSQKYEMNNTFQIAVLGQKGWANERFFTGF